MAILRDLIEHSRKIGLMGLIERLEADGPEMWDRDRYKVVSKHMSPHDRIRRRMNTAPHHCNFFLTGPLCGCFHRRTRSQSQLAAVSSIDSYPTHSSSVACADPEAWAFVRRFSCGLRHAWQSIVWDGPRSILGNGFDLCRRGKSGLGFVHFGERPMSLKYSALLG